MSGLMVYREHAPPDALTAFVSCLWEITGGAGAHRVLPDGAMDVIFAAGDGGAHVVGPMTRAIVTPDAGPAWIVGARFLPGAAVSVLGVSARELLDSEARAREVWGAIGRTLDAKLADARGPAAARAVLVAELVSLAARARRPDPRLTSAVTMLRAARGELPLTAVAARAGVGERQLERLFLERVGYGPKLFARVARLAGAVSALSNPRPARGSAMSWASLARASGYADQAHMIREFRALTGVTPVVYARARAARVSEIDNTPAGPAATLSP